MLRTVILALLLAVTPQYCPAQFDMVLSPANLSITGIVAQSRVYFDGINWVVFVPPTVVFSGTSAVLTHNLNRRYVRYACYDTVANEWFIPALAVPTSVNVLTFTFNVSTTGVCTAR